MSGAAGNSKKKRDVDVHSGINKKKIKTVEVRPSRGACRLRAISHAIGRDLARPQEVLAKVNRLSALVKQEPEVQRCASASTVWRRCPEFKRRADVGDPHLPHGY